MKVFFSRYELKPRGALSSRASGQVRAGALLRIEHSGFGVGYADLHPWPELGDLDLEQQLHLLRRGELTSLTRNTVEFSRIDAAARAAGQSLWSGLEIPQSHWLVTDLRVAAETDEAKWTHRSELGIELGLEQGFDRIKIKVGRDLFAEAHALNRLAGMFQGRARLRLDFNESGTPENVQNFLEHLSAQARESLDFLEDPTPWRNDTGFGFLPAAAAQSKAPHGFPRLALDRAVTSALQTVHEKIFPEVLVIKPANTDWQNLAERAVKMKRQLVVTSYLDHPLGQLSAAWVAAKLNQRYLGRIEACGLLSHIAYKTHAFSELLAMQGPRLIAPSGTGWGWDQSLGALDWKALSC